MVDRTFGWVQDPGDLTKLRRAVEVFCRGAKTHTELCTDLIPRLIAARDGRDSFLQAMQREPLRLSYRELVGTAFSPRGNSRCNGIMQAALPGQKRAFSLDWPADNFVRWAHALGFVEWNADDDDFAATDAGVALSKTTPGSDAEYRRFADGLLSYPPAVRVIGLLADAGAIAEGGLTKFDIGKHLGFQGEQGFTTISRDFFVKEYSLAESADMRKKMKQNWEGTADKYARMICGWLMKLKYPWARRERREFGKSEDGKFACRLDAFTLTATGFEERKKTTGASSMKRSRKRVPLQMLCTKGAGRALLRARRARILDAIQRRAASIAQIQAMLAAHHVEASEAAIAGDLRGLENIGLAIEERQGRFRCRDKIVDLTIAQPPAPDEPSGAIQMMKEQCAGALRFISHNFLVLIDMGFDKRRSKLFEIKIAELLIEHCGFRGRWLGGQSRPDVIVYDEAAGAVIDAKSYQHGFSLSANERDKMLRYLTDAKRQVRSAAWWRSFPPEVTRFIFLFVSGKFTGNVRAQLRALGELAGTGGAAVTAPALLLFAEQIAGGAMTRRDFLQRASRLEEMRPPHLERPQTASEPDSRHDH